MRYKSDVRASALNAAESIACSAARDYLASHHRVVTEAALFESLDGFFVAMRERKRRENAVSKDTLVV